MNSTTATVITDVAVLATLAAFHVPPLVTTWLEFSLQSLIVVLERVFYKTVGVNPDVGQSWKTYATSVLSFSAVSILFLLSATADSAMATNGHGNEECSTRAFLEYRGFLYYQYKLAELFGRVNRWVS